MRFAHLYGGDDGETHWADRELPADVTPPGSLNNCFFVPTSRMVWTEYPEGPSEMIPGLHTTTSRHFIVPLRGGFEVTTSTGDAKVFREGDWILFDDLGSRGHLTKGLDGPARINLVLEPDDEWTVPGTE